MVLDGPVWWERISNPVSGKQFGSAGLALEDNTGTWARCRCESPQHLGQGDVDKKATSPVKRDNPKAPTKPFIKGTASPDIKK